MYLGKWGFPIRSMNCKEITILMQKMKIEKAIAVSALSINYDFVEGNKLLASKIRKFNQLFGYVYINGNYVQESLEEMKKYLCQDKFVGVKFHPEYSRCAPNDPKLSSFWEIISHHYRKPVLIHTWTLPEHNNLKPYSLPEYSLEVAKEYPDIKIILGHMGGVGWVDCLKTVKTTKNIWLDFCSSYADRDKIKFAAEEVGSEKILFGSSMSENNGWMQIGALTEANISNRDRHKIAYENALKLFNFKT